MGKNSPNHSIPSTSQPTYGTVFPSKRYISTHFLDSLPNTYLLSKESFLFSIFYQELVLKQGKQKPYFTQFHDRPLAQYKRWGFKHTTNGGTENWVSVGMKFMNWVSPEKEKKGENAPIRTADSQNFGIFYSTRTLQKQMQIKWIQTWNFDVSSPSSRDSKQKSGFHQLISPQIISFVVLNQIYSSYLTRTRSEQSDLPVRRERRNSRQIGRPWILLNKSTGDGRTVGKYRFSLPFANRDQRGKTKNTEFSRSNRLC